MKRIALSTLSLALLGATGVAHAQSSVTLYGLIDESIQFAHNTVDATGANKNQVGLVAGNLQGSRWGLKGTEDLGGGLKAIFQLENGFDPNNGRLGQGSRMFGRQAYVGLTGDQWGTVTLGRQYDPLVDLVQPLTADNYFGSTFTTPGDVDNNDNSSRTNNAVKYTSPVWGGFQFEGMYAFGGVAGQTGAGQTWSGAATYATGPFSIAAGYFRAENPHTTVPTRTGWGSTSDGTFDNQINGAYAAAKSIGIASVAVQYVAGPFTANARYSNAQYKPDAQSGFGSTEKYNVAGAYLGYQATPALLVGVGYTYTKASGDASATYHQVSLGGDYNLSKRTDIYLVGAYQHASGDQRAANGALVSAGAAVGSYSYNSASSSQEVVSLGIRHKF
ncbi:porin [bacterium M00.F.Ca.ET.228.01.1.1]|uniref:porin n=1 Tax=Paraburkholderia phenoliruptrix TaxID=252970 RepID=UPI001091BC58|nr:porin [Paraburkholderia phenoliruptrix]TGP47722.1 porin [bacterium M00.F.Ca.ET.228.01.1.1]TGS05514.1 porin [bacterium M00.F.Ca.ET.191.01.1.1]TGU10450.1 porin [bacterium M00.F.Ca.ET.155.01.1.1]MBW0445486.1 porin [Paraburkholderia phenoliruptrix]MBW9096251.1 porin [Paraburkholderia phenoliruptrix]